VNFTLKLDERIKRLIAVGASITVNCQPCLEINVAKALENGAGEQEIAEAIQVGKLVRQGAAVKMDKLAASLNPPSPLATGAVNEGCCCK
jgi:AhpD family alkylhydroperoxidase